MGRAIVLFDFDGTLADTFESGAALINEFAVKFGYKPLDFAAHRNLSARELVKLSGVRWWQIPKLVRFFRRESVNRADRIKPFNGIEDMVQRIFKVCDIGILTTNASQTIGRFLDNLQLEKYFCYLRSNVPLFGKSRALRRTVRMLKQHYTYILYVGDEIRDIEACRKVGLPIVSVSWGFNSREILAAYNDSVADSADELAQKVLDRVIEGLSK